MENLREITLQTLMIRGYRNPRWDPFEYTPDPIIEVDLPGTGERCFQKASAWKSHFEEKDVYDYPRRDDDRNELYVHAPSPVIVGNPDPGDPDPYCWVVEVFYRLGRSYKLEERIYEDKESCMSACRRHNMKAGYGLSAQALLRKMNLQLDSDDKEGPVKELLVEENLNVTYRVKMPESLNLHGSKKNIEDFIEAHRPPTEDCSVVRMGREWTTVGGEAGNE